MFPPLQSRISMGSNDLGPRGNEGGSAAIEAADGLLWQSLNGNGALDN